jgi:DNA-binding NtrC family response regulator
VFHVRLPSLRERREDIVPLATHFLGIMCARMGKPPLRFTPDAEAVLRAYDYPGNVRELRNLIESMVVLAPDHEILPGDLPRHIREGGGRLLPVHIGPILRGQEGTTGRELEFIVRSLLELKLQIEELRRRMDEDRPSLRDGWIGEVHPAAPPLNATTIAPAVAAIEPRDQPPPPNVLTLSPGTTMAEIERAAIEIALKETRGNRRRAAEMLGIGERTLYRKIKEYRMPEHVFTLE